MKPSIDNLYRQFQELFPAMAIEDSPISPQNAEVPEGAEANEAVEPKAVPQVPCRQTEHAKVGYDLDLSLEPTQVIEAAKVLDAEGFTIDMVTAVDWPDENQFELLYDFFHFHGPARVVVRTRIPRDQPVMPSLSAVYPGANWHERETAEFFGIDFTDHPNLIHLLLPEDFTGYPLRKDFNPQPDLE